jgi:hypothetical protein
MKHGGVLRVHSPHSSAHTSAPPSFASSSVLARAQSTRNGQRRVYGTAVTAVTPPLPAGAAVLFSVARSRASECSLQRPTRISFRM